MRSWVLRPPKDGPSGPGRGEVTSSLKLIWVCDENPLHLCQTLLGIQRWSQPTRRASAACLRLRSWLVTPVKLSWVCVVFFYCRG